MVRFTLSIVAFVALSLGVVAQEPTRSIDLPKSSEITRTLTFKVAAYHVTKSESGVFLNSLKDYKSPDCLTIFVSFSKEPALKEYAWRNAVGLTIRATGESDGPNKVFVNRESQLSVTKSAN